MKVNWTYIIGGLVVLLITFFLGWFARPSASPKIEIKERTVYDTTFVPQIIKEQVTKTITRVDTIYKDQGTKIYSDSLKGSKEQVEYNIKHTIKESDSVYSFWDVEIKNLAENITEYVVKDSIQTLVETKYVSKPFFLNEWFYVSVVEFFAVVAITITALL